MNPYAKAMAKQAGIPFRWVEDFQAEVELYEFEKGVRPSRTKLYYLAIDFARKYGERNRHGDPTASVGNINDQQALYRIADARTAAQFDFVEVCNVIQQVDLTDKQREALMTCVQGKELGRRRQAALFQARRKIKAALAQ